MSATLSSAKLATAWLAAGLLLLPCAYRIAWDAPRAAVLVLLAPALWFGRALVSRGLAGALGSRSWQAWCAAALVLAVLAACAASRHWAASLVTTASWCLFALTAILVAQVVREWRPAGTWLLAALAGSAALGTVTHWVRWFAGEPPATAFYLHHRLMGLHTFSGAFASVALVLLAWPKSTAHRIGAVTVCVVSWAGLLWTGSRSPLVGIAAGSLVWLLKLDWPGRRRVLAVTAALALGGMALSAAAWTDKPYLGWWNFLQRSATTQTTSDLTSHRSDFWAGALGHIKTAPWLGHGPDAYGFLTPQLEGAQPHNLVLQLLLDIGAPATVAALALLAWMVWRGWKHPAVEPADGVWVGLAVSFCAAGQLDGYFYYAVASLPAMIALGACAGRASTSDDSGRAETVPLASAWRPLAFAAAAVLLLHCGIFHRALQGEPPASPDALAARIWRAFPSTTVNVDDWIERWAIVDPAAALAMSRHARPHSPTPELFRVKSALLLARRGELPQAITELELARAESLPTQHPAIDALLQRLRQARPTSRTGAGKPRP